MTGVLNGKVAIVTGAGRGIGRADALALAGAGAAVVVNDLGVETDGSGTNAGPAEQVVAEIRAAGGRAVADTTDITDWNAAKGIVDRAVASFGSLDILINNAGIARFGGALDAISRDDWERTIAINLNGTAALCHWASAYWRGRGPQPGRVIVNTTSEVGLSAFPDVHMPNAAYAASKAGVAALTRAGALELAALGVRVNAVAPVARSRISEFVAPDLVKRVTDGFDRMAPENVAAVVLYLASPLCQLSGKVIGIMGSDLSILKEWSVEQRFTNGDLTWTPQGLESALVGIELQ